MSCILSRNIGVWNLAPAFMVTYRWKSTDRRQQSRCNYSDLSEQCRSPSAKESRMGSTIVHWKILEEIPSIASQLYCHLCKFLFRIAFLLVSQRCLRLGGRRYYLCSLWAVEEWLRDQIYLSSRFLSDVQVQRRSTSRKNIALELVHLDRHACGG